MTQPFNFENVQYWITVLNPTVPLQTGQLLTLTQFLCFWSLNEPGFYYGEQVKDLRGVPLLFHTAEDATTAGRRVAEHVISNRLELGTI